MTLKELEKILDNATVTTLEDQDGFPIEVIAFLSKKDARATHRLLREVATMWRDMPDFLKKTH